jgi:hypothetical protein
MARRKRYRDRNRDNSGQNPSGLPNNMVATRYPADETTKERRTTSSTTESAIGSAPDTDAAGNIAETDKIEPRAGIEAVAPPDDLDAVHAEALERYEAGWEKERQNQNDAYDDLKFLADDIAQWDPIAWQQRKNEQRPILTVNKCPQFVRQVTGDIRQMRPAIHVVPVDERAKENVSTEVLPEMVRYIERRSDAKAAYFVASDQMVASGIGHCRVYTEYAADSTFNQEIAVGPIADGVAVVWDPDAIELTRSDAMFCFVPVDFEKKRAEDKWPGKNVEAPLTQVAAAYDGWMTDAHVRVAEYWRKVPCERELAFYPDGRIVDLSNDSYMEATEPGLAQRGEEEASEEWAGEKSDEDEDNEPGGTRESLGEERPTKEEADYRKAEGQRACANCTMFRAPSICTKIENPVAANMLCNYFELRAEALTLGGLAGLYPPTRPPLGPGMGPKRADATAAGARIEKRDSYYVERFVMNSRTILEGPERWPGMHIPIVPFIGEEVRVGRRVIRRGIVRQLKDVQRLYNWSISTGAEAIALQPKSPYKGTRVNFEKTIDQWETANIRNWPFLEYEPDPANGGRPPEREPPPVASSGIAELQQTATADMSSVTGIYPAQLGAAGPETSGKAIVARQREGDTGTFHYVEAFARALERVGQIVVDLIPHVYDTERTLRNVGDDGKPCKVCINKQVIDPNGDGIATMLLNDVTVGAYQVSIEMGPSYSTKREEAREGIAVLMQSLGQQVAPLFADIFVRMQDLPLADQLADRLKFLLPPQIQQAEAAKAGEPPPPPPPPPPPDPKAQVQAAELQLKKQKLDNEAVLQAKQFEIDQAKLQVDLVKVHAELQRATMAQQTALATSHADRVEGALQRGHEVGMAAMDGVDRAQQQQIETLTTAVDELQQAMMHMAQMIGRNGGAPPTSPAEA